MVICVEMTAALAAEGGRAAEEAVRKGGLRIEPVRKVDGLLNASLKVVRGSVCLDVDAALVEARQRREGGLRRVDAPAPSNVHVWHDVGRVDASREERGGNAGVHALVRRIHVVERRRADSRAARLHGQNLREKVWVLLLVACEEGGGGGDFEAATGWQRRFRPEAIKYLAGAQENVPSSKTVRL